MALASRDEEELTFVSALRGPSIGRFLTILTVRDVSPLALIPLAALPVLVAVWALLSPPTVLSQEMTWDLLFNLTGAWYLHFGQIPHVDFHEPVGQLNFILTAIGFHLSGLTPRAFITGMILMAAALFVSAAVVAFRRLPLLPAAIFIVFVCLLVLMPANVGDLPNAYSFAMSYNRYGWSGIAILFLILFLPPRSVRFGDGMDMTIAAALLIAMFYLKMTYFAVALATLPVAAMTSPHVRMKWRGWAAVGLGAAILALLPYNYPYWSDLFAAARSGQVRGSLGDHINSFLANAGEYAPYIAALAVAIWMWRRHTTPARLPLAIGFILAAGGALLSQNAQSHGLPAAVVIAFLFYDTILKRRAQGQPGGSIGLLLAVLVFPLLSIATSMASLAGYHDKAMRQTLATVDNTNLRGLAVPREKGDLLAAFARGDGGYQLLNRARSIATRYELSPYEYVETLLEAAELFADTSSRSGGIVLLDQVNPLPYMLGLPPTRGGNLWSGPGAPVQPAAQVFADARWILIPKFPTYSPWTEEAVATYGPYLDENFPVQLESQSWILLERDGPLPSQDTKILAGDATWSSMSPSPFP